MEWWEKGRKGEERVLFQARRGGGGFSSLWQGGQRNTAEKAADKNDSKYNFSTYPVFQSASPPVHLSLRPLCASNGENAASLAHVFFSLPLQTMIDG